MRSRGNGLMSIHQVECVAALTFRLVPHGEGSIRKLVVVSNSILIHTIENRVISVGFHMLLQILRTFEGLATELATMRLQGHMNTDMRSYVIALDDLNATVRPGALQIEVICAFAPNMFVADMILDKSVNSLSAVWRVSKSYIKHFRRRVAFSTSCPQASKVPAAVIDLYGSGDVVLGVLRWLLILLALASLTGLRNRQARARSVRIRH